MTICRLHTAATVEPVTVTEMAAQLVLTDAQATADATLLGGFISAARQQGENITGAAFVESTWEQVMDGFPAYSRDNTKRRIDLLKHPVISVTSLSYVDDDGDTQTLTEGTDFTVELEGGPGFGSIYPAYGTTWPSTRDIRAAVTIVFRAGWVVTDGVPATPENLKLWVMMQAAGWYENRESMATGSGSLLVTPLPRMSFDGLLDGYRRLRV